LAGLIEDIVAISLVGLVVLGIAGIVYRLFKPEGWGSSLLGYLWDKSPWLVWLAGFSLATVTLVGRHAVRARARQGSGNLLVYGLVVLGAFFLFRLVVTGNL
jgi:hypothetical protein